VKIVVSREAVADLERLSTFLADKSPASAKRAVAVITEAVQSLDLSPDRGRTTGVAEARELIVPFGRSAYVIRYAHLPQTQEIVIVRIWHGREDRE
jgi:plasmid stabilization system protein ParE